MADDFKITITGLDKVQARLKNVSDAKLEAQMERTMLIACNAIRDQARRVVPVAFGALKASIQSEVPYKNPFTGRVYVGQTGYGESVEKGTRPHFPPIAQLQRWADQKGINVWAVAKSIAKKGTKAQPYMQPTFIKMKSATIKSFKDAINYLISLK